MSKFIDLTGQRFERLTVIKRSPNQWKRTMWLCKCDCGNERIICGNSLKRGLTTSCGCYHKKMHTTHGKRKNRLYRVWDGMKQRCYNANNINYKRYGGRGISICDEWKNDFSVFCNWAYASGYDENAKFGECTIERKNNNGNYEPNNCCFTNMAIQGSNRRMPISNTSGVEGVSYCTNRNKWEAYIRANGKRLHLGRYDTIEQAAAARKNAELTYCNN